ncbi:MAG: HNH endonuclease signature motif containing protein [Thermoguttaceae bacterium]|jgi:hypothetical protein
MSNLSDLKPKEQHRIIDLVRDAGIDVSDWGNFKGSQKNAGSNPKYCYEWAFEAANFVVLNLWFAQMVEEGDSISRTINYREIAHQYEQYPGKAAREKRARRADAAIQRAWKEMSPVRVVICDGKMRSNDDPEGKPSIVKKRLLDERSWAVTAYDMDTGECVLTRGASPAPFVDQFTVDEELHPLPKRQHVSADAFVRDPRIRKGALSRANGKCEWCEQPGFITAAGKVFLETHHITSLAEGGSDSSDNVVALCPNHHREAHHGANRYKIKTELLARLLPRSPEKSATFG